MIKFKRVLVPTDFSEHAKLALDYAVSLPFEEGGELLLVHSIEPTVYPIHQVISRTDELSIENQVRKTCQMQLDDLAKEVTNVNVRTLIRDGYASEELVEMADEEGCDLIVISTHGRSGIKHLLMGSTAERVVRKASCPVLTVRKPMPHPE
ncbi:MAG: universal stress protein [Planctomycetes bacterium]|nr:universal stress protein [Planctomycetota bacterium]